MNIIITGASRGIGKEIVKLFASDGKHTVYAVSRNVSRLNQLASECENLNINADVKPITLDLNLDSEIVKFCDDLKLKQVSVDILINNAGVLVNKPFEKLTGDDFDKMFNVNVKSVFLLTQALKPLFNKNAHILNISSMGGYQGSAKFPGLSLYSASKGAVAVLTESLAEELKDDKIFVNCLALGAVQTEMLAEAFPGYQAPLKAEEMASYIYNFAKSGWQVYNGKILPVSLSTP